MEDTNISKLYKDFESIPSLCRYDVTVSYQGEEKELSQTSFTTRLLIVGQAVRVEQCTPSVSTDSSPRHEAGNFFPIPSTPTSFAIYIGFQKPEQEGTLLEAKFQQSPFAEGGYTWDIVGNKSHHGFGVSLEVHLLSASPQRRVDISYKTKTGTTSFHIFPSSGDSGEFLEVEEHFLHKLVDLPPSKARADALLLNGLYLYVQSEQSNRTRYLDLSIQALSAGQLAAHGLCGGRDLVDPIPYIFFCHLLFIRCTLPDGDAFVDEAFSALDELERIPVSPSNDFLEPFVKTMLLVIEHHKSCPDHRRAAVLHIARSILILGQSKPEFYLDGKLIEASKISVDTKEDLAILDRFVDDVDPMVDTGYHTDVLVYRALSCLRLHWRTTEGVDRDLVVAAIESVRTHFLNHGIVGGDRQSLCNFFIASSNFLSLWRGLQPLEAEGFAKNVTKFFGFIDWAISIELVMEPEGLTLGILQELKTRTLIFLWIQLCAAITQPKRRGSQLMKELVKVAYDEDASLGDDLVEFITDQMMDMASGVVPASSTSSPTETINAIIGSSLSTKPRDPMTLIRVVLAATMARYFDSPLTMALYQLLMSNTELFHSNWMIRTWRNHHPMTAPCVSSDAISHALALGHHELALEWADQRSCLGWRHILYFQSSFSQVAAVDPELAEKLTALASELFDSPPQPSVVDSSTEAKLNVRHATCAAYWKGAVSKARKLPGLGRFLAPTTFTEIQSAVDGLGGPVVYFNLNRFSCDALCVIPKADEVVHIPLPCLSIEVLEAVAFFFRFFLDGTGTVELGRSEDQSRLGKLVKNSPRSAPIRRPYVGFPQVLEHLWDWVVKPVLDGLAITRSESNSAEKLPRIWWCPSGLLEMFPLHAAGLYQDGNGDNIMNYVVSSYIPSSDLISHVTRDQKTPKPKPRFLTVANPTGCGLPGTDVELETIRKHLTNAGPITELTRASATPDAVKQELQTATWAHFACHGVQVEVEDINGPGPTSCLFLANYTRLTLLEISKLKLPQAQLAFLSACDTAQERPACTGESVHIAAGMLVAGFRSVIGTMWKISDEYAPELADLFYQKMFEGVHAHGQVPDYRRSAYALHDAVKALRQRGVDFKVWVPFLHYGA